MQNKVFGGAKQLRGLRPSAGVKTSTLILLLARVAAAQCDLRVIAIILNEKRLAVFKIVGIRHKNWPLIIFLGLGGGNRQPELPPSKELFRKTVPGSLENAESLGPTPKSSQFRWSDPSSLASGGDQCG
jgi:hypothetical protein